MPAYKLDPEWVMSYLTMQEEKLTLELQPDQKDVVMNKIRELTLSIMYKQARRYLVYFESSEPDEEDKNVRLM
ncbi:hypothetical protein [Brevibacillus centrosporus]|uniref:Uncharacterized protein n=1 Tax=Brevibacillus centrosporus TaxID=54910 RepID=A0A1I3WG26_9BACL|nr:hypothetical protein [Brevibacillus centrosporus]MEC2130998.1 hypothetical protein [Brevibacillus centrosporus]MED1952457.1 hypothetical protein [Brevibacillus centrosporus]MED4907478.1 hypothetical protein [Brevibacillus centrosporus]RNB63341.1 hypothetical protein EDM55_28610 [Brevibacillus centrosporus]SFK06465.1 hypothetical protein SAMN05518846_108105 [Brevibacillus centrosporus]